MIYGSVCSGIEAATVAWHPLGWKPAFFSEIAPFPSAVLAHHYPTVRNFGDFTTITPDQHDAIDLLVGGTPCQSFSIAGLRGGLADDRGNLALEYLRLADRARPRWLVWENVPGVLSSSGGRDFGAILGGMVELGYGIAYRVLDAQFVRVDGFWRAVPQRRRRVFVVGYLGDWRRAAAVLFERASLLGDNPPGRKQGEGIAPTISSRPTGGGGLGTDFDCDGGLIPSTGDVAHCLNAGGMGRQDYETETIIAFDAAQVTSKTNRSQPVANGITPPLHTFGEPMTIAYDILGTPATEIAKETDVHTPLRARLPGQVENSTVTMIRQGWAVRRLTPRECERLQAFPDDYTLIPWRKGVAPDGPRYKALGNSMAVNVMRWIGRRIELVETMNLAAQAAE